MCIVHCGERECRWCMGRMALKKKNPVEWMLFNLGIDNVWCYQAFHLFSFEALCVCVHVCTRALVCVCVCVSEREGVLISMEERLRGGEVENSPDTVKLVSQVIMICCFLMHLSNMWSSVIRGFRMSAHRSCMLKTSMFNITCKVFNQILSWIPALLTSTQTSTVLHHFKWWWQGLLTLRPSVKCWGDAWCNGVACLLS